MAQSEIVIAAFLGIALVAALAARKLKLPYTVLLVVVGLVLAASPELQVTGIVGVFNSLSDANLFAGLILPPILFESIMGVRVEDFRAVYRPALLLATVGVLVSTVVVGVVLWKVVGLSVIVSFLFAALISPTDVATVIEIFSRANVPGKLATLVDMESVFNDATGITIFTIVSVSSAELTLKPFQAFAGFAYLFGGGALVGFGVAWGARQVQRQIEDSVTQVVLTLVAAYGAYTVASLLGVNGLVAVAMAGLFYGNTVLLRMESKQVATATREFWKVLAFLVNAVAFLFIGVSTNIINLASSLGAMVIAYLVVLMARITSVYPILNFTRAGGSPIPPSWMNVATLGGMRGALAIALVSAVPADIRPSVATLTFGVVMISILIQGPLLTRYAKRAFGVQETLQTLDGSGSEGGREKAGEPAEHLSSDKAEPPSDGV